MQQRQPNAARTAAQIQHARRRLRARRLDRQLTQPLSVAARNQHIGRHTQGNAIKIPLAQQIGQRFAREPARQQHRQALPLGAVTGRPGRAGICRRSMPKAQATSSAASNSGMEISADSKRRRTACSVCRSVSCARSLPHIAVVLWDNPLHGGNRHLNHTVIRLKDREFLHLQARPADRAASRPSCRPAQRLHS